MLTYFSTGCVKIKLHAKKSNFSSVDIKTSSRFYSAELKLRRCNLIKLWRPGRRTETAEEIFKTLAIMFNAYKTDTGVYSTV